MKEDEYKKQFKFPSCRSAPFGYLIPFKIRKETLLKIKNETIDTYGEDLSGECSKRKVCFSKDCIGRKLPWNSPTAMPYLKELAKRQGMSEGSDYYVSGCLKCPIASSCSKSCPEVNDYILRSKDEDPKLIYKPNYTDTFIETPEEVITEVITINNLEIPWDILTKDKIEIIKTYLYKNRDFKQIDNNQAKAKYKFYLALNKLSEYGVIRKFLDENKEELTQTQQEILHEIYYNNKKLKDVAYERGISKQAVSNIVANCVKKYNIRWQIFVKKHNGKVVYAVPEILK